MKEKIAIFHQAGIRISSSMIFGFDTHSKDIFKESEEFCRYIELDEVEGVLLIPFPGMPLFQNLKDEGRILSEDWSKYDGGNVVFQPKTMTVQELNEGSYWFWERVQKNPNLRVTSSGGAWDYQDGRSAGSSTKEADTITGRLRNVKWKALFGLQVYIAGLEQ